MLLEVDMISILALNVCRSIHILFILLDLLASLAELRRFVYQGETKDGTAAVTIQISATKYHESCLVCHVIVGRHHGVLPATHWQLAKHGDLLPGT